MAIVFFKFQPEKYPNKTIFPPFKNVFLQEMLHFDKLKLLKSSMIIVFSKKNSEIRYFQRKI